MDLNLWKICIKGSRTGLLCVPFHVLDVLCDSLLSIISDVRINFEKKRNKKKKKKLRKK